MIKLAAVTGISQTARSFVQALCSCQNQKFIQFSSHVIDYAYLIVVSVYSLMRKQMVQFASVYMVSQVLSGSVAWIFYMLLILKQKSALRYQTAD